MSVVNQQFGDISQTDMSTLTEAAFAFQDLSGYSPEESLRAANTLMNQFGLTAEEAYNLMVQGMQKERLSFDRSRVEQKAAHGIWIKSVMLSRKMQSELLTYLIQLLRHLKH